MIQFIQRTQIGFGFTKKEFDLILQEANFAMPTEWHSQFAALHFTKEGARKYKYQPRKGEKGGRGFARSYTGRKKDLLGHTLPLVWSGGSRTTIIGKRDIRANPRLGKAVLNAPTLNFRPAGNSRINMFEEMTRIVDSETEIITGVGQATMSREMNASKARKTEVIK